MKIEKAIEILEARQRNTPSMGYEDLRDANQLGIEALKRLAFIRINGYPESLFPLPGETEE